jgi:hypothetical protein
MIFDGALIGRALHPDDEVVGVAVSAMAPSALMPAESY